MKCKINSYLGQDSVNAIRSNFEPLSYDVKMALDKKCLILSAVLLIFARDTSGFQSVEEYFEQWRTTDYYRLAPFGAEYYDTELSGEDFSLNLNIYFSIPFYGRTYTTAYVVKQGAVFLGSQAPIIPPERTKFPNQLYDGTDGNPDPTMLATYYAQSEVSSQRGGSIYHRIVDPEQETPDSLRYEVAEEMLRNIQRQVRWAILGAEHFHPSVAVIVTWFEVSFTCVNIPNPAEPCPKNTFQNVIATDGNETYVIYNYYDLTWENSRAAWCDEATGTTTDDSPDCFPAQVGFNAGQGREFHPLPYSNTKSVLYLDEMASHQGRYVYEVSGEVIRRGECLRLDSYDGDKTAWPLGAWPPSYTTIGGEEVHISGVCLNPSDTVNCRFNDQYVSAKILDDQRAACILPAMFKPGEVSVQLHVNDVESPFPAAKIMLEHPGRVRMPVVLEKKEDWLSMDVTELSISWDPRRLHPPQYEEVNITTSDDDLVDIVLYGYRKVNEDESEWVMLTTLSTEQPNSGHFTFNPEDHNCEGEVCEWAMPGGMKVVLSGEGDPNERHGLFSGSFPLHWFISDAMTEAHGSDWAYERCKMWRNEDDDNQEWTQSLPACPCLFNQALNDKSWIEDPDCEELDMIPEMPNPCLMQSEPSRCFIHANPGPEGQSSRCCYNNNDHLVYSGENDAGSFSCSVHPDGVAPYDKPDITPHWGNWLKDKMIYLFCCKLANNKDLCYDQYLRRRPTPDCKEFHPPGQAVAFGDPHFRTFDGTKYTFNPHGEFWLVKVDADDHVTDFKLQARMEVPVWPEMSNMYVPAMNATVLTAVVMVDGNTNGAPKVEMRLNAPVSKTKVSVLVNDQIVSFDDGVRRKEYWGTGDESNRRVLVLAQGLPDPWTRQFANFTVLFESGVVVRVAGGSGLLQINTVLPHHYREKPRGLFGAWVGEKDQDLINSNGDVVIPDSNEKIHREFGMSWVVPESETLFLYIANKKWDSFSQPDFRPYFELDEIIGAPDEEDLQRICGDNYFCRFDYMTLVNGEIAALSLETEQGVDNADVLSAYVPACQYMDIPNLKSADRSSGYYLADGSISYTECQAGYSLRGSTSYTCNAQEDGEANWQPDPDIICKSNKEIDDENARLAAAIAVPICLIAIIVAVLGGVFFMRRKKNQTSNQTSGTARNQYQNDNYDTDDDRPPSFKKSHLTFMDSKSKEDDHHKSNESVASRTSNASIVLSQELTAARPLRPTSTGPKLTQKDRMSYGYPGQMEEGNAQTASAPTEDGITPKGGYENLAASKEDLQNKNNEVSSSQQDLRRAPLTFMNDHPGGYGYQLDQADELPLRTSVQNLPNRYGGSQGSIADAIRRSQENLHRTPQGSQENLYRTPRGSQQNLAGPPLSLPPRASQENLYRPPSQGNLHGPPRASQENLHRTPRGSQENLAGPPLSLPLRASQENLYSQPRKSQENLRASQENLARPPLSMPPRASQENLYNPARASQENLSRPMRASQENLSRPFSLSREDLARSQENLSRANRASQENLSRSNRASQENLSKPVVVQQASIDEPAEEYHSPALEIPSGPQYVFQPQPPQVPKAQAEDDDDDDDFDDSSEDDSGDESLSKA